MRVCHGGQSGPVPVHRAAGVDAVIGGKGVATADPFDFSITFQVSSVGLTGTKFGRFQPLSFPVAAFQELHNGGHPLSHRLSLQRLAAMTRMYTGGLAFLQGTN